MTPDSPTVRPLRIAFLDSWLQTAAEGSGTAVGINGLEQALRQLGHTVERIAPPPARSDGFMALLAHRLRFNLTLPWTFDPHGYDLVVGFDIDGFYLTRAGRLHQPYVCSIKGVIAEELLHERGAVRATFVRTAPLEGGNARRADRVLTTSQYCRDRIAFHYDVPPERIGIVPEGIDVAAWQSALSAAPPRDDPRPTILCVARQYPRKHIADLLHAFALIARRAPLARLRIVGDGPEHANLAQLTQTLGLAGRVDLLGSLSDDDLKREYAHSDIFCLPSVQEGFGIVFLEAMAAGLPVVSTTAAAIPETVRHGETGILLPPGDVHALAGALLLLLTDADRRAQYGQAAQAAVAAYDWLRVADLFLQEIAALV
jgi:glycosyltransferase involved in cell wall biosynthesis